MTSNGLRSVFLAAATSLMILLTPALAGLPAIYDRIPAQATLVITTKNLDEVDAAVSKLFGSLELPALATPSELLSRIGLGQNVDMTRPLALALMPGDLNGDNPPAVIFLPTTGFGDLMDSLNAQADGDLFTFTIETGETLYARSAQGGYAIIGPIREIVAAIDGKGGNLKSHEAQIGEVGDEMVNAGHLVAFVKKPLLSLFQTAIEEKVDEGVAEAAGFGAGGKQGELEAQAKAAGDLVKSLFRDARDLVLSIKAGALGLSTELAMDFEPDSQFGAMFQSAGDSSKLLAALPNQPFLFAYAGDFSTPAGKDGLGQIAQGNQRLLFGDAAAGATDKLVGLIDGMSGAIYTSPGGLMGGLVANSVTYLASSDPKGLQNEIHSFVDSIGKNDFAAASYQPNASEVDGVSVDGWSVTLGDQAAGMGGVQQATSMLFGPGGLGGYFVPTDGGLYQTLSRNNQLVSAALAAKKGQNSLIDFRALSMVAKSLPDNRTAEAYIGVESILKQGLQIAAMFGMPMQIDLPDQLPPVGFAITTDRSAGRFAVFVPAPVLKTSVQVATQAQAMFGGNDDLDNTKGKDAPPF